VTQTFAGAALVETLGALLKYHIPSLQLPLASIFELIENNRERLSIREYSLGQTTLEQIFIDFAKIGNSAVINNNVNVLPVQSGGNGGLQLAAQPLVVGTVAESPNLPRAGLVQVQPRSGVATPGAVSVEMGAPTAALLPK